MQVNIARSDFRGWLLRTGSLRREGRYSHHRVWGISSASVRCEASLVFLSLLI